MKTFLLYAILLSILFFSCCSNIDQNSVTSPDTNTATDLGNVTNATFQTVIKLADNPTYGKYIVDGNGMALYLFTVDEPGKSNCYGGCATAWPPLYVYGSITALDGLVDGLGTTIRTDGQVQVTYKGKPLYYFVKDQKPGDVKGEGVAGQWYAITKPKTDAIPSEISLNAKDWPLPNKDYNNTRATKDSTINSGNINKLGLAWSLKIPGVGAYGGAASTPLILGDKVYFQDLKANVFSLDFNTGQVNWQKTYNISAVVGPNGPAVGWGKVFIAKDLYTMAALDINTGEETWTNRLSYVDTTGIDIQPQVYNNMVYVSTVPGTGDVFYAPGGIGVIYALNQNNGLIKWNFSTVDTKDVWGHPEVNSGGGCWYTPAVDTETGAMYWGVANPAPFPGNDQWPSGTSRPGLNLYTDSMVSLDSRTGVMNWYKQVLPHDLFDFDFQIAPILANANVSGKQQDIVIGAGKMGRVYAFNRDTGEILWVAIVGQHNENDQLDRLPQGTTRITPSALGGVETPMAYSDGIIFVPVVDLPMDWNSTKLDFSSVNFSKSQGELVALDANTGKILWYKVFDSLNVGGATVVNDLVFTATYDGKIYGFRKTTGEQLFTYTAPAGINAWPAVAKDTIIWPAGVGGTPSLIALKIKS